MGHDRPHAVVVGGGIAGLATALFLGRRGYRATVLERDRHLPAGGPGSSFPARARPGIPQARQPHNFLGCSVRVLREEAPDVLDTLVARGVLRIPLDLGEGPGDAMVCARRPLFESILRQAARAERAVAIRDGVTVTGIVARSGEVPVVTGVTTDVSEAIRGDLVVDAAGRRSPLPVLLQAHGTRPAVTASQDCDLMYMADASLARRMQAAVDGRPSPPPEPMERLRLAIFNASRTDAPVALPLRRMIHLLALPQDVIGNEVVRTELSALLAARPELTARAAGPRREEISRSRTPGAR